jgi:hypothetical protein
VTHHVAYVTPSLLSSQSGNWQAIYADVLFSKSSCQKVIAPLQKLPATAAKTEQAQFMSLIRLPVKNSRCLINIWEIHKSERLNVISNVSTKHDGNFVWPSSLTQSTKYTFDSRIVVTPQFSLLAGIGLLVEQLASIYLLFVRRKSIQFSWHTQWISQNSAETELINVGEWNRTGLYNVYTTYKAVSVRKSIPVLREKLKS